MHIPVQKAGQWELQDVPTPAILTSSWQSSNGRVGHLFVNISETTQPLHVSLDTRTVADGGRYDAEIYRSTQGFIQAVVAGCTITCRVGHGADATGSHVG